VADSRPARLARSAGWLRSPRFAAAERAAARWLGRSAAWPEAREPTLERLDCEGWTRWLVDEHGWRPCRARKVTS
jgi:hypothetical protein